jgi:CDP-glucose 4,6-dehydratase
MKNLFTVFKNKTVLITGHSGFKGSWLSLWLSELGAKVIGISLNNNGPTGLFNITNLKDDFTSYYFDIANYEEIKKVFDAHKPDIIFHLAAQALINQGYKDPLETFRTNIIGTANILEACKQTESVKSVVCVTTDKVYDNKEWCWPYREEDKLGGKDAYSASKAAAEIVAYSYMTALNRKTNPLNLATARGGNVIGGGDWSENRIIPDLIRAIRDNKKLILRNPSSTRPWQHILELCYGYMSLAEKLYHDVDNKYMGSWNFGPEPTSEIKVIELIQKISDDMELSSLPYDVVPSELYEANYLKLDSSKAKLNLDWHPVLNIEKTTSWTAEWYKGYFSDNSLAKQIMLNQINDYQKLIHKNEEK